MFNIKDGDKYSVYMHVFPNGKVYVGITSQDPPENRWLGRGVGYRPQPRMWRAIQKYGWENIEHIIIARYVNIETAKNMEIDLIKLYDSANKDNGYNASPGGWIMGEESKKKLSESSRGKKLSDEHKEKLRLANIGRTPSKKAVEKLKEYNKTRDYTKMVQPNEMLIIQYDIETARFVREYKSINCAAKKYNVDARNIKCCMDGHVNHYIGYLWMYKQDANPEYILRRLYEAQNPQRFCPVEVTDINTGEKTYYKSQNEFSLDSGYKQGCVSRALRRAGVIDNKYRIGYISIPEYVLRTGRRYFNKNDV